ncbi:MAG TPA: energy transducer TonB [Pyrinomonadaceae bacterium]|nr:energy transducer TonB [Pyrinomonadaceae bacterium]
MNRTASLVLTLLFLGTAFALVANAQESAVTSPGIELFNKGDYAGAVAALKDTKNYIELSYLGLAYEKLGNKKEEGKAFDAAVRAGYWIVMEELTGHSASDPKDKDGNSISTPADRIRKAAEPIRITLVAALKILSLKTKFGKTNELKMIGNFLTAVNRIIENRETVYSDAELTTKLKVTKKMKPSYTDIARQSGTEGTVKFLVLFGADGKAYAAPIISLENGLTTTAYLASRDLEFTPAAKDGKPVAVFRQVEYSFDIY